MLDKAFLSIDQFDESKKYWIDKLSLPFEALKLPYDERMEGNIKSKLSFTFDQVLFEKITEITDSQELGVYVILLSALKVLLFNYIMQNDVIIGSPVYAIEDWENQYNDFILFRDFVSDDIYFKELLNNVKQTVIDGYKNQHYPLKMIFENLHINTGIDEFLKVILIFEPIHKTVSYNELLNLDKTDIILYFFMDNQKLFGEILYNQNLFYTDTITRFLEHYYNILRQVLRKKDLTLFEIQLLTEEEKTRIMSFSKPFDRKNYSKGYALHQLFEEQVNKTPNNTVLIYNEIKLTYLELDQKANQLANYLRRQNKITNNIPVGILNENPVGQAVSILGILKAGAAFVPLDGRLPQERLKNIINDANIPIIISSKKNLHVLNKLQWECPSFNTYLCLDSDDVLAENEFEKSDLMAPELWEYIGNNAINEIQGGGWINSYTGEDMTEAEMLEYSNNIFQKLKSYLNPQTKVLEIGCASGISMFQIAPHVGLYYGTDLSKSIIEKNRQKVVAENIKNVNLKTLAAHEISLLEDNDFDIIIMNSVIQCFHGYNYLRKVIVKAIELLKNNGIIFIGDIMDQDLKDELVKSLIEFKQKNLLYKTKTDLSAELFVSRKFFQDLQIDLVQIEQLQFSKKNYTIENELTKFRYDAILTINKQHVNKGAVRTQKHKNQHGLLDLHQYPVNRASFPVSSDDLAYIIYTSGTTGQPKGVMIEHGGITQTIQWRQDEYQFNHDDKMLQLFSFSFDGYLVSFFNPICSGAAVILLDSDSAKDPTIIRRIINEEGITHFIIIPVLFEAILDYIQTEESTSLRLVTLAGDQVTHRLVEKSKEKLPWVELTNEYGPTETSIVATIQRDLQPGSIVTIGKPISNTGILIVNQYNNQLQPIGGPGEIYIYGDRISRGYLNSPELTDNRFITDPIVPNGRIYKTGDLGRWLPDGTIEFLGRIDYQVKIRGFRIELGDIESKLLQHELIRKAVVVDCGEGIDKFLCVYFTANKELSSLELKEFLAIELPEYMIPVFYIQLNQIPITHYGKVDRKALSKIENIQNYQNIRMEYVAPKTDLERMIVEIWREVLKLDRIGIHDNFFDIGGNSILIIRVNNLINQRLKTELSEELSVTTLFQYPTIHSLVQYLNGKQDKVINEDASKNIFAKVKTVLHETLMKK